MPEIVNTTMYACSVCSSQHKTEKKAAACEKKCLAEKKIKDSLAKVVKEIHETATSPQHLLDLLNHHIEDLFGEKWDLKFLGKPMFGNLRNTHSAPIGQKTNWQQKESDGPKSFLGFNGAVAYRYPYKEQARYFVEKHLYLGTGGHSQQAFTVWLQDYPRMQEKAQQEERDALTLRQICDNLREECRKEASENEELVALYQKGAGLEEEMIELQERIYALENLTKTKEEVIIGKYQEKLNKENAFSFDLTVPFVDKRIYL